MDRKWPRLYLSYKGERTTGFQFDPERREVHKDHETYQLTRKQSELIKALVLDTGLVVPRIEMVEALGYGEFECDDHPYFIRFRKNERALDLIKKFILNTKRRLPIDGHYIWSVKNIGYGLHYIPDSRKPEITLEADDRPTIFFGENYPTFTELAALMVMYENFGKIVEQKEHIKRLWGLQDIDPHLLNVHIALLRRKMLDRRNPCIVNDRGYGYGLVER